MGETIVIYFGQMYEIFSFIALVITSCHYTKPLLGKMENENQGKDGRHSLDLEVTLEFQAKGQVVARREKGHF